MTETAARPISVSPLQDHFADLDQQRESSTLGMWVFLITEVMFFGGMFTIYLVHRIAYEQAFAHASEYMTFWAGTVNTAVLICSSLCVVLAVYAAQTDRPKQITFWLMVAVFLGLIFLGIKGIEYHEHWVEHMVPGRSFAFPGPGSQQAEIFFTLYFIMTGFHALHVLIGMAVLSVIAYFAWQGRYTSAYHNPVENAGLYWHFVDIVWIFLYPLLYLISHKHV